MSRVRVRVGSVADPLWSGGGAGEGEGAGAGAREDMEAAWDRDRGWCWVRLSAAE